MWLKLVLLTLLKISSSFCDDLKLLDVPLNHLPLWAKLNLSLLHQCQQDSKCSDELGKNKCWGYEIDCTPERRYMPTICEDGHGGWIKDGTKQDQMDTFYKQADFGYIEERIKELRVVCRGHHAGDTLLECVENARLCRAKNLLMNFKRLNEIPPPVKYRQDIMAEGLIGGHCRLNIDFLRKMGDHKSPLQSWFAEIEHFTVFPERLQSSDCDVVIKEPTMIVKLDATVNMYHHFCDFVNLYATLHFNETAFHDINVMVWDVYPYRSNFQEMWKTITSKPLQYIGMYKDKPRVCFKNVVMPFLPRMIFGLYYNMPLVPGCAGSGMIRAFREHTLHRLKVPAEKPEGPLRVTFISRSTEARKIINEDFLVNKLNKIKGVHAMKVDFNFKMPFIKQISISANTDILIGMHGAGLTHSLFLPEWAAVFEVYNCGDKDCYKDLARLSGAKYFTWKDPKKLEIFPSKTEEKHAAHEKFSNYKFDPDEFIRIFMEAKEYVDGKLKGRQIHLHDEM